MRIFPTSKQEQYDSTAIVVLYQSEGYPFPTGRVNLFLTNNFNGATCELVLDRTTEGMPRLHALLDGEPAEIKRGEKKNSTWLLDEGHTLEVWFGESQTYEGRDRKNFGSAKVIWTRPTVAPENM